jgi:alkyl hydroperoxide reductase subunit AhpF
MVFCEILVKKTLFIILIVGNSFFSVASASIFARAGINTSVDACASGGLDLGAIHFKFIKIF